MGNEINKLNHHFYTIVSCAPNGHYGRAYCTSLSELKDLKKWLKADGHTDIKSVKVMPGAVIPTVGGTY